MYFREQAGRPKCPLDPFFIMPDKCTCVDFQTLKLQELPDSIPQGEMPRHMSLYCDRLVMFNVSQSSFLKMFVPRNVVTTEFVFNCEGIFVSGLSLVTEYLSLEYIQ